QLYSRESQQLIGCWRFAQASLRFLILQIPALPPGEPMPRSRPLSTVVLTDIQVLATVRQSGRASRPSPAVWFLPLLQRYNLIWPGLPPGFDNSDRLKGVFRNEPPRPR